MKKLELKHLAPYLPYGLKMTRNGFVGTLMSIMESGTITVSCSDWYESINDKNHYKPILRPLSDLTKEITVNGETFVPIAKLLRSDDGKDLIFETNGKIKSLKRIDVYCIIDFPCGETVKHPVQSFFLDTATSLPYYQIEKLFKWHFDVFGLIKQCLAIDINTLNK